eukprot:TRINITY_DN1526_c0_g1_i1.p1 TRINITY_DN1526_c0_g1~~TRINITY_DN1526_c0_g1_i1.p1  ORF type:complete len:277 (+),score=42.02 TRINITY_DN1526_c0_g1_i1:101-931(+)
MAAFFCDPLLPANFSQDMQVCDGVLHDQVPLRKRRASDRSGGAEGDARARRHCGERETSNGPEDQDESTIQNMAAAIQAIPVAGLANASQYQIKCEQLIVTMRPLAEFIGCLANSTLAIKPKLQQRMLVGFWLLMNQSKVAYTATHLYVLRICEVLALVCVKPSIEKMVALPSQAETPLETYLRKIAFWKRSETTATVSYLQKHFGNVPGSGRVFSELAVILNTPLMPGSVDEVLRQLQKAESHILTAISRRLTVLQGMLGQATSTQPSSCLSAMG